LGGFAGGGSEATDESNNESSHSIFQRELRVVHSLGPFNGTWDPDQVKFLGAILASAGSGVFTFALLMRRAGGSSGRQLGQGDA
jgi:hypothetical protein